MILGDASDMSVVLHIETDAITIPQLPSSDYIAVMPIQFTDICT